MGVRRLAVANGPNIFQMLLVFIRDVTRQLGIKCAKHYLLHYTFSLHPRLTLRRRPHSQLPPQRLGHLMDSNFITRILYKKTCIDTVMIHATLYRICVVTILRSVKRGHYTNNLML